jgi:hypothetical protein
MDRRGMLALVVEGQAAVHAFDWHRVSMVLGRMAVGLAAAQVVPVVARKPVKRKVPKRVLVKAAPKKVRKTRR